MFFQRKSSIFALKLLANQKTGKNEKVFTPPISYHANDRMGL
jgi:hypothetical protein